VVFLITLPSGAIVISFVSFTGLRFPCGLSSLHCFNILDVLGDRLSQESVTILCDQEILFVPESAEILVDFNLIVIYKLGELAFCFPHINQLWDEINPWFDSDDKSRL